MEVSAKNQDRDVQSASKKSSKKKLMGISKIVINVESIPNDKLDVLEKNFKAVNDKDYGEKITPDVILLELIKPLGARSIKRLQENSCSPEDKIKRAYELYLKESGKEISYYEWLLSYVPKKFH